MKFFRSAFRKISFLMAALLLVTSVQGYSMGTPHRLYSGRGIVSKLAQKTSRLVHPKQQGRNESDSKSAASGSYQTVTHSLVSLLLGWAVHLFTSNEEMAATPKQSHASLYPCRV